jgi:hypothetical protein
LDWIDEVLVQYLDGLTVGRSTRQRLEGVMDHGRSVIEDTNDPARDPEAQEGLEILMQRIQAGAVSGRTDPPAQTGYEQKLVTDEVVTLSLRGFCPKWPWC